jgi:hypothetical protein
MRRTPAIGWAATAVGLAAWASALTLLPPAMPSLTTTPLWVAELRWAALLLAGLGLLAAVSARLHAWRAAGAFTGLALLIDSTFVHNALTGPAMLALALVVGAAAAGVAERLAGPAGEAPGDRNVTVAAIVAACCGPLLFAQGTGLHDAPALPASLTVLMAVLPAAYVVFAFAAIGHPALGALALPVAYLGTLTTSAHPPLDPAAAIFLAGPLTALVYGLTRPQRTGVAYWSAVGGIAVLLAPVAFVVTLMLSGVAAGVLFAIAGGDYPVDGISAVPPVAALAIPIALAVQRRAGRREPAAEAPAQAPATAAPSL